MALIIGGWFDEKASPCGSGIQPSRSLRQRKAAGLAHWTPIDGNYAWARFSLKLHGWAEPREFFAIRERVRENKGAVGRKLICANTSR